MQRTLATALALTTTVLALPAQQQTLSAYPNRDELTPFRACTGIVAAPDAVFQQLRILREQAERTGAAVDFDANGITTVNHPVWRQSLEELRKQNIDAGWLARILRESRNADERDLAFFGMFFCAEPGHVCNLIAHIPGEPERATRQKAYRRAVAYLRAHLARRFGDLGDEQRKALLENMPAVGSPAAKAMGITRTPVEADHLYVVNLTPFFQMLDLGEPVDQAQALWFLKEVFSVRPDLAKGWLEPAMPRVRGFLEGSEPLARTEARGLLAAVAPKTIRQPEAGAGEAEWTAWTVAVTKAVFPPIRTLSEALFALYPSEERTALAARVKEALSGDTLGDSASGKTEAGEQYWGFRVARLPKELEGLGVPAGAVVTALNGRPVRSAKDLLATGTNLLAMGRGQRSLFVDYVHEGRKKAVEYRVMAD